MARTKQTTPELSSPFESAVSLDTGLVGHAAQQQTLVESLSSGRMHHAWLLHGPKGIGKARFALQASAYLVAEASRQTAGLGTGLDLDPTHPDARLIAQNAHPDALWLDRLSGLDGKKKMPKTIPVASVRAGLHKLQATAAYGGWRTLVVDAVDDLNTEGANALLKPLEEPPKQTVLFLIAHRLSAVLPTLRSRCRHMAFSPLSATELSAVSAAWETASDGLDPRMADLAVALAGGRAGALKDLTTHPEQLDAFAQFCRAAVGEASSSLPDRLAFAAYVAGLDDTGRASMLGLIDDWFSRRVRDEAEPEPLPSPSSTLSTPAKHELANLWSTLGSDLSIRRAINLDVAECIMALFAGLDRVYSGGRP